MSEEKKTIDITDDTRLKANPDYILREIGGECILVPVGENNPFGNSMLTLNETSAFLWKKFMEGSTPKEVLEAALNEYESDQEDKSDIVGGVYSYIVQSLNLGLLLPEEQTE